MAYSIGALINLVTNSVNSTFAPYQYQKIKSGEYDLLSKRANEVLGLVAAMLFALMLFSKEIVLIFGGQKYIDSVNLIVPICIGIYFNYMFQLFARVQEYFEKKLTVVIPSVLCAIMNIVLNYVFIKLYG
uniref:lipopolysaccharide biosynthesis protein n=1 Tax=Enterococcus faecium TaxID=1352 RepID=UPI0037C0388C